MDSSRRAVESYWRSRMIDGATLDEDKVTPVYKLEEICELLRSSHVSIVKEVSGFIFNRLDHKSPIVKQKALRLIKYVVGQSGVEFRREMQRNSAAVRQLIHYKGQLDPLKGDSLNKSVRATAQEALSAIFSTDDNKPAPADDLTRRIEGFGNSNFEMPSEDKKSFLSEVVGLGSATIKQRLNSLTQAPSHKNIETGSYKSPNLRRSLTTEINYSDRTETQPSSQFSKNVASGTWAQDIKTMQTDTTDGSSSSSYVDIKTREERLLETIVASGGVRLQPTRDALHVFLIEASKLDALALCHALESKLQSHLWQVRVKAVCVLEAILRKKDEHFSVVKSYFRENKDVVVKCCESPQASLREKANKVLGLLDGELTGIVGHPKKQVKAETSAVQMPDLIDTGGPDGLYGKEDYMKTQGDQSIEDLITPMTPIVDDIFGDSLSIGVSTSEQKNNDDPFADVSFYSNNDEEHVNDVFSGMTVDKSCAVHMAPNRNGAELFDIFGSSSEPSEEQGVMTKDVNDLMSGLSIKGNDVKQNGTFPGPLSETIFSDSTTNPCHQVSNNTFSGMFGPQTAGMNENTVFPTGAMPYNLPSGIMFNPAFPSQPINYGAMGSLFAQQQFLATMANLQQLGNLNAQNSRLSHAEGTQGGGYSSALPDVFNSSIPTQTPSSMMNGSKKETRAFDFISDHLTASRDPKRVI